MTDGEADRRFMFAFGAGVGGILFALVAITVAIVIGDRNEQAAQQELVKVCVENDGSWIAIGDGSCWVEGGSRWSD